MNVSWWCSGGGGEPWEWTYRPYLGVWVMVGLIAGLYFWANRALSARGRVDRSSATRLAAGLAVLALASDWPLGPLGAGYSATVAMVRVMLYSLVAAPLLVSSIPTGVLRRLISPKPVFFVFRTVTRWPVAFVLFNSTVILVSTPIVVDTFKTTQFGSFLLDVAVLASSLILWYPVFGQLKEVPRLGDPGRAFYVLAQSILPIAPASFLTFSRFPLFKIYELAPPFIEGFDPVSDQQIAGLVLNVVGGLILFGYAAVLLLNWAKDQETSPVEYVPSTRSAR